MNLVISARATSFIRTPTTGYLVNLPFQSMLWHMISYFRYANIEFLLTPLSVQSFSENFGFSSTWNLTFWRDNFWHLARQTQEFIPFCCQNNTIFLWFYLCDAIQPLEASMVSQTYNAEGLKGWLIHFWTFYQFRNLVKNWKCKVVYEYLTLSALQIYLNHSRIGFYCNVSITFIRQKFV